MVMSQKPINRATTGAFFVVVVSVALCITACGSSTPTAAEFNGQANTICRTFSAKLKSVGADLALAKGSSDEKFKSDLSSAIAQLESGSSQLQALARPNGENAALEKAFKSQNTQIKDLKDVSIASKQRDGKAIASAETAFEELEAPLNQQFDALGLSQCGSG